MFGQYDGFVIVDLPDSRAAAATSLAVSSTGAFEHLETHELIEAEDLNPILERAKGITSQLPGTSSKPVRQRIRSLTGPNFARRPPEPRARR
jgi:GYD domain